MMMMLNVKTFVVHRHWVERLQMFFLVCFTECDALPKCLLSHSGPHGSSVLRILICYLDLVLKTLPSITDGYQKLNNYNKKPEDLHLFQNVLIYIRISDAGQSAVCICKYHYQWFLILTLDVTDLCNINCNKTKCQQYPWDQHQTYSSVLLLLTWCFKGKVFAKSHQCFRRWMWSVSYFVFAALRW